MKEAMRINKYIAHHTAYSRREADRLIEEGHVSLNKRPVTEHGTLVQPGDRVSIKGKVIKERKGFTVAVYNKPKGVLVSKKDDRGRTTIYHLLPGKLRRFIPVGRLDFASEGLLLLTDAPEVADALMRSALPRTYNIKIDKPLSAAMLRAMEEGLALEDATAGAHKKSEIVSMRFAAFEEVVVRKEGKRYTKLRVTIREGKNRELRRFFAHFGAEVLDLKRVAYGWIALNNLPENKTRYLDKKEYAKLHAFLDEMQKGK